MAYHQQESRQHEGKKKSNTHPDQYSQQYSQGFPDNREENLENEVNCKMKRANTVPEDHAAMLLRQISRTYSTDSSPATSINSNNCTPSPTTPSVPSFTLTFPIVAPNSEQLNQTSLPTIKTKIKNYTTTRQLSLPSHQDECQKPKFISNTKRRHVAKRSTEKNLSSNNGFPFTISKILEEEDNECENDVKTDTPTAVTNFKDSTVTERHNLPPVQAHFQYNLPRPPSSISKSESNANLEQTTPDVSWTMNIAPISTFPSGTTAAEIDEDYDA